MKTHDEAMKDAVYELFETLTPEELLYKYGLLEDALVALDEPAKAIVILEREAEEGAARERMGKHA